MAEGFLVCIAPDLHISYLHQNQGFVHSYLDGEIPSDLEAPSSLPEWWPKEPPKLLTSWNINYRNTDLYHWILNGGPDLVSGGGAIFQTWYEPGHDTSVVKLDKYNERFGFYSEKIDELASLVAAVNVDSVLKAFVDWCKSQGKSWEGLDVQACTPFVNEFEAFKELLDEANSKNCGIVW